MKIKYLGHSSFYIEANKSVVTDPFHNIGYEMERVSADYCLISHSHFDHNAAEYVKNATVIDGESKTAAGKEISLCAIKTFHDEFKGKRRGENLVYKFTLDGVSFCHLGDIGERLNGDFLGKVGGVDVLFVPIGGNYTINEAEAAKYVDGIKPKLIVPMHYKTAFSNIDIDGYENFTSRYKSIIRQEGEFVFDRSSLEDLDGSVLLFKEFI